MLVSGEIKGEQMLGQTRTSIIIVSFVNLCWFRYAKVAIINGTFGMAPIGPKNVIFTFTTSNFIPQGKSVTTKFFDKVQI